MVVPELELLSAVWFLLMEKSEELLWRQGLKIGRAHV
jgi:hypothetical protein